MNKRLSALLSAGLLSLFAVTALASAAAGDYAKGNGSTSFQKFSFVAEGTGAADRADGRATVTFTQNDPNIVVKGNVTCMLIVGNTATIGGQITDYRPSGAANIFSNANGFVIFASDASNPSNGLDGFFFQTQATTPAVCPTPFPLFGNVITGDIEIVPGL
jgi:hypothetical protein